MKSAEELVRNTLSEYLGEIRAKLITPEANLRDTLEMDSLDMFFMANKLGVDIQKNDQPETVQDLVEIVKQQNE